jgi:hypothetical protein
LRSGSRAADHAARGAANNRADRAAYNRAGYGAANQTRDRALAVRKRDLG